MALPARTGPAVYTASLPDAWLPLYADVLRRWVAVGRPLRLPLSGASMRPTIDEGVTVVVVGCDTAALRTGDVIVYEDAGRLICHRVLGRRRRSRRSGPAVSSPTARCRASAMLFGRPGEARLYLAETLLMDRPQWMLRVAATTLFPSGPWLRFHYGVRSPWRLCLARVLHPLRVCALAARALSG